MLGILANMYYLTFTILWPNSITLIKLGKVREADHLSMVAQLSCGGLKGQPQAGSTQEISHKLLAGHTQNWVKARKRDELHLTLNFNK